MTIYSAVIKPALPLVVVSRPFCCRKLATVRATPQQAPPTARSFQERVARSTMPFCTLRRTRHSASKNKKAIADRAVLKVKGST